MVEKYVIARCRDQVERTRLCEQSDRYVGTRTGWDQKRHGTMCVMSQKIVFFISMHIECNNI